MLPVAGPMAKVAMDEAAYKLLETRLDLGLKSIESVMKIADRSMTAAPLAA